jgi:hypothetical protein
METTQKYISYLIGWITAHSDVEFDPLTEFEVIRVIIDSFECFYRDEVEE